MKPIFFTKMEGSGNDFLIINNHNGALDEIVPSADVTEFVKKLAHRHLGAGSDGVVFVGQSKDYPFSMKYYNRDGTEAGICLNGARCVVGYTHRLGIIKEKGKFLSGVGPLGFYFKNGTISIEVQPPTDIKLNFSITAKRKKFQASSLKIGVPHCVIFVESLDDIDVKDIGSVIRGHKQFGTEGINVNFAKVEKDHIFVRTYERGVEDETMSCGSGVLASAYIATKLFLAQTPVTCRTRGGNLLVNLKEKLYLEGPANYVYDGVYYYK
jgi:diaminopimelate epimerase